MKLETCFWHPENGWSVQPLPSLDSQNTLVLLFGGVELINNPYPIEHLKQTYPHSHLIGCSTAGEILGTYLYDHTLCVAVVQFEQTQLRSASYLLDLRPETSSVESYHGGRTLATQLNHPDLKGVFILGDGLSVNGSELLRGLNSILNPPSKHTQIPTLTGGLAGDSHQFQQTWVLAEGIPRQGAVTAVGFYGEQIQIGFGCQIESHPTPKGGGF